MSALLWGRDAGDSALRQAPSSAWRTAPGTEKASDKPSSLRSAVTSPPATASSDSGLPLLLTQGTHLPGRTRRRQQVGEARQNSRMARERRTKTRRPRTDTHLENVNVENRRSVAGHGLQLGVSASSLQGPLSPCEPGRAVRSRRTHCLGADPDLLGASAGRRPAWRLGCWPVCLFSSHRRVALCPRMLLRVLASQAGRAPGRRGQNGVSALAPGAPSSWRLRFGVTVSSTEGQSEVSAVAVCCLAGRHLARSGRPGRPGTLPAGRQPLPPIPPTPSSAPILEKLARPFLLLWVILARRRSPRPAESQRGRGEGAVLGSVSAPWVCFQAGRLQTGG